MFLTLMVIGLAGLVVMALPALGAGHEHAHSAITSITRRTRNGRARGLPERRERHGQTGESNHHQ